MIAAPQGRLGARSRDRIELAEDTRYVHYRKEVLDFLYTRHGHVEKQAS